MPNDDQSWPPPPTNYQDPSGGSGAPFLPVRHGCLTAWLIFALIAHSITILIYSLMYQTIHLRMPSVTPLVAGLLVAGGVASITCVLALFQWRRWGFYGIAVITTLVFGLNLTIGVGAARSLSGLLGIALLYWVLKMGGQNSAWRFLT